MLFCQVFIEWLRSLSCQPLAEIRRQVAGDAKRVAAQ
jgi:hypothetical protein